MVVGYRKTNSLRRVPRRGFSDYDWKEGFKRKGGGNEGVCFWMLLVMSVARPRGSKQFSLMSEPKERTVPFTQESGGYVRVTLVNVCGIARQGNLTGKSRRLAAPVNSEWVVIIL
jgi:hypothetical protein